MAEELTLEVIFEKSDILIVHLKERQWGGVSGMLIPSILKTADKYIDFLKKIEEPRAKRLCEELILLRRDFRVDPYEPPPRHPDDDGTTDDNLTAHFIDNFPRADECLTEEESDIRDERLEREIEMIKANRERK